MSPSRVSQAPADFTLAAASAQVTAEFATTPGSSARVVTIKVGGLSIATWVGGVLTVTSPYVVTVSNVPSRVAITLDRTGGWSAGAHSWVVDYSDSDGSANAHGSFAVVTVTPAVISPAPGQTGVSRRPTIYVSFDLSAGTPVGVDVFLDGSAAVRPHFEVSSGGSGTRSYAGVRPRRGFRWGSRVVVRARPRVAFGGGPIPRGVPVRDDRRSPACERSNRHYRWNAVEQPRGRGCSAAGGELPSSATVLATPGHGTS